MDKQACWQEREMAVSTTLTFFNHLGRKTYLELGLYYIGHQQRCL